MTNDAPDTLSLTSTPFERVLTLCEAFTLEFGDGSTPLLDSYLKKVDTEAQPALLRNLLALEIENRRAAGEQPRMDQYLERFPQFSTIVREVFMENPALSPGAGIEQARPRVASTPMPIAGRLGDYRLLGQLGQGGMGAVYEAIHQRLGNRVALKTLPTVNAEALHRFKREFRALADLNHPNLVGLHSLEAEGSQWFLTMDLIEGVTFAKHVRPGGTLDEARLRSALAQLVSGVMALHGRHIIHRDLKPANVMVTAEGHVVILDFGLVLEVDSSGRDASSRNLAGTVLYMAPEQGTA